VARRETRKTVAKTPDIRTVASLARVSIATVSRTVNGSSVVSDRLKKRVWHAIHQLNYFPNSHARTLVSGRSRLFGIIVENITNPFFPELIQSFEEIAVANGYEILVGSTNGDPAVLTRLYWLLREIAWVTTVPDQHRVITGQLIRLEATTNAQDFDPTERANLTRLADRVTQALHGQWP